MIDKKTTKVGKVLRILYQSQNQWVSTNYIFNRISYNKKRLTACLSYLKRERLIRRDPLENIYITKPYWRLSPKGMKLMNWIKNQGEL